MRRISNHPVHLLDREGRISPSAFTPFCEFGGNISLMGEKVPQFEFPVCTAFRPTVLRSQLCYFVDVNKYLQKFAKPEEALKTGLFLLLDYNAERDIAKTSGAKHKTNTKSLFQSFDSSVLTEEAKIHIGTIGDEQHFWLSWEVSLKCFVCSPIRSVRRWHLRPDRC